MSLQRFALGLIVATPGAVAALSDAKSNGFEYLARHAQGDWAKWAPSTNKRTSCVSCQRCSFNKIMGVADHGSGDRTVSGLPAYVTVETVAIQRTTHRAVHIRSQDRHALEQGECLRGWLVAETGAGKEDDRAWRNAGEELRLKFVGENGEVGRGENSRFQERGPVGGAEGGSEEESATFDAQGERDRCGRVRGRGVENGQGRGPPPGR